MSFTVKVGKMPGAIQEFAFEEGVTVRQALELAGFSDTAGYEVKADGVKVTDLDAPVASDTRMILLAKQVKGNAGGLVKIGKMPGAINEFGVEVGTSIRQALELAGFSDTAGFEVKVDGQKVTDLDNTYITEATNMILLAKQVKGN